MKNTLRTLTIPAALVLLSTAATAGNLTITRNDVEQMTYKVGMATRVFEQTWRDVFAAAGYKYPAPKVVPYADARQTGCGKTIANNAFYCQADNTVYYDARFLTAMMKGIGAELGTDGDMAPIVILAHEMGHAVALMLGADSNFSIFRENLADCLAGVAARYSAAAGYMERGDLEEGLLALQVSADSEDTGILSDGAHGSAEERKLMFMRGYRAGIAACDERLAAKLARR